MLNNSCQRQSFSERNFFGNYFSKKGDRGAFSLIELLIVVVIVGIVYTLAVSNFDNLSKDKEKPTLAHLKNYLSQIKHLQNVRLVCVDKCESCSLYVDDEKDEELSELFDGFLDSSVKVYVYNINTGLQQVTPSIVFNSQNVQEEVCFALSIDKEGISEQVIVEYKKNIYDFTSYLTQTQKYSSIDEFIDKKQESINKVLQ